MEIRRTHVKKIATALALAGFLTMTTAVSCEVKPTEYYPLEWPDCDADDKVGKWDTMDCGPSPVPTVKGSTPKPGAGRTPAPRKTR